MPQYQYQAFNSAGRTIKGSLQAESPASAKNKLRADGLFPSELKEVLGKASADDANISAGMISQLIYRIPSHEMANMTRQLATMVAAHIPLAEALTALVEQVEHKRLRAILARVKTDVNEGSPLHQALGKYPDVFPDLYVSMISAGEASGALDIVLIRLADFMEYQDRLKSKVQGAMIYPLVMILVGVAAVLFIFTTVIPKLETVFEQNNAELPLITQIVLSISRFTLSYWWAMILVSVVFVFGVFRFLKSPYGSKKWDEVQLKIPIFGEMIRMVAVSRFAKTLSTLLRSGIPLLKCLNVVKNVVTNHTIREAVVSATENLTEGQNISGPLKRSGQFPPLVTHMISVGERTGDIEEMLEKVSDHYEYQVDTKIQAFTALMEPIMIVILAFIVAVIVLSVILPMLELNNTVI